MALRSRVGGVLIGFSFIAAMGVFPSLAQDPAKERPAASSGKKAKEATGAKSYRRVPAHFAKIGLTAEQKEKIYAIRGKHQEEIDGLKAQIEELGAKELAECEGVLLESQKKVLTELRASGKASKKAD